MTQVYKPWTAHIFNGKRYIADAEGNLHKVITDPKCPAVKHILNTKSFGEDLKYDITEYDDGTYSLRIWTKDAEGLFGRYSKLLNQRVPNRKIIFPNMDAVVQVFQLFTEVCTS